MRLRLLTLAALACTALSVRADSFGTEFAVNGSSFYVPGSLYTFEPINSTYVPGVGTDFTRFSYGATSNTITFSVDTQLFLSPSGMPAAVPNFVFVDRLKVDDVIALTLDPSSTLLGIVPTIGLIYDGPMYGYESTFTFDFSKVTLQPGQYATFDAVFASAQTPEPSTLLFLATGLVGIAHRWKRRII